MELQIYLWGDPGQYGTYQAAIRRAGGEPLLSRDVGAASGCAASSAAMDASASSGLMVPAETAASIFCISCSMGISFLRQGFFSMSMAWSCVISPRASISSTSLRAGRSLLGLSSPSAARIWSSRARTVG